MASALVSPLEENVARKNVEHTAPAGVVNGVDVSAQKQSWKSYLWDTWDKSPEVRNSIAKSRRNNLTNNLTGAEAYLKT